jgi:hypothetical protein
LVANREGEPLGQEVRGLQVEGKKLGSSRVVSHSVLMDRTFGFVAHVKKMGCTDRRELDGWVRLR